MKPTLQYRIMAFLHGKRRPRSVADIVEYLNTESPGPRVTSQKVQSILRHMAIIFRLRFEDGGYLHSQSKYFRNVGKPWSSSDIDLLDLSIQRGTPIRIIALKLARFEEEVIRKRPAYSSRKK